MPRKAVQRGRLMYANAPNLSRGTEVALSGCDMDCRYYPHALGHWLGMDTHDAALNSLDLPLQPNVVLTIEPGAYLAPFPSQG